MDESMKWMLANGYEFKVNQNPKRLSIIDPSVLSASDIVALEANWVANGIKTVGLTLEGRL